jgi:DNA-binding response OmpR family regulator
MDGNKKSTIFSKMLADLRHDLRTPAGHVMGYAEMLEEEYEDEDRPDIISHLATLRQAGALLVDLIDEHLGANRTCHEEVSVGEVEAALTVPVATITETCRALESLLAGTDGEADLAKIERARKHLVDLIEGLRDALDTTSDSAGGESVAEPRVDTLSPAVSVMGEGGVILVVDDNEANRDLLERRLRSQGYDPVTVDGGEAAIEFLGTADVDMILLDMIMPGLDGTEVLGRLKGDAKLKNIPVVMLSALDDMERIIECISMGAEDYLFKPPNPVLLKARISATLEKNRLRRQLAPRLQVFISSPSDVEPERAQAKRVIDRLNEELAGKVYMIPVLWEDEPLRASETAQTQIVAPRDTDIYIGIFWARMGTMLPEHIRRPDGSRYGSGTEFEFEDALAGHEENKRPEILVYRKTAPTTVILDDRTTVLDRLDQKEKLEQFIRRWFSTEDGLSIARVYHAFDSVEHFEDIFERHLRKLALDIIEQAKG